VPPTTVQLLFPHQLFKSIDHLDPLYPVYLVEEYLFFRQYKFHKQKIALHRSSMKFYEIYLNEHQYNVLYIDSQDPRSDIQQLLIDLIDEGVKKINIIDPVDDWLTNRISKIAASHRVKIVTSTSPCFINTNEENKQFFADKKRYFQTDFYIHQRKKLNILVDQDKNPIGGKWSFDSENRERYPKGKNPPTLSLPQVCKHKSEAYDYVEKYFDDHYGAIDSTVIYPCTFDEAERWLDDFLLHRFYDFGVYEDAMVSKAHFLHHSVLTPMLNIGLLTPMQIINKTIDYAAKNDIPINSLEGFVRQIIGWREFIRAVYILEGRFQRTHNFYGHKRGLPQGFYNGNTGIAPIDITIQKVLKTAYNHHIERLMILGNFMVLCEIDPDKVYQWFMEMYIDAYDWVMVPNVYGMTQYADGGILATKPYVSGSNYIVKMADYPTGTWQTIWDSLFWNFMHNKRDSMKKNPRLSMLMSTYEKMSDEKKILIKENAERFMSSK
jgi:deoxyribodipyrimidine photolyase-related protein